jgi:hypothetical protein
MSEAIYKGVLIRCRNFKLADDGGFIASFTLIRSVDGENEETPYGPTRSFKTRGLAEDAALSEARSIIDGKL